MLDTVFVIGDKSEPSLLNRTRRPVPVCPVPAIPAEEFRVRATSHRPRPALDSPNQAMGAKATAANEAELRAIWETIVGQVVDGTGLALGVELDSPRQLAET